MWSRYCYTYVASIGIGVILVSLILTAQQHHRIHIGNSSPAARASSTYRHAPTPQVGRGVICSSRSNLLGQTSNLTFLVSHRDQFTS